MKILYIGGGYVGACSAAVAADSGHDTLIYDIDKDKVDKFNSGDRDKIESALFEEGLGDMIVRNKERIKFTYDLDLVKNFVDEVEAVFMCLPTPEKAETGQTNLEYYEKAADTLAQILKNRNNGKQSQYILVINKSTVPIDMVNQTQEILESGGVKNFGVGANPEFLVEGKAIEGSIRPDRVVVGAWTDQNFEIFKNIYHRFNESPNVTYIEVNPIEAAASKLLANFLLFNRVVNCYDVVGRVSEKFDGIQFENLRKVLTSDPRIGSWGFFDSLFAGGSCFIKDARSLSYQLRSKKAESDLVDHTLLGNNRQLDNFLNRAEKELDFDWLDKQVGILGLAFKRQTNDIRNSASLGVTEFLLQKQVKQINVYDPVAIDNFLQYFETRKNKMRAMKNVKKTIANSDVLIIATDWPEFREIGDIIMKKFTKNGLVMDGRRMLQHRYEDLKKAGFRIIAVGSPLIDT